MNWKKLLFYVGAERSNYLMVKPAIAKGNRTAVILISCTAVVLIGAMLALTFTVSGVESNRMVYSFGLIMTTVIALLAIFYKDDWVVLPLVYATCFVYYMYGIVIGTITDPSEKTVTFVVMLVFLPVLFTDRPIRMFGFTAIYIGIFIMLCLRVKTGGVLQNDIIDSIVFGVLGQIVGYGISRIKIHGYILERKLTDSSRFDMLTQMNNRNSYEKALKSITGYASRLIACVYIDVNGLHELNNEYGHDYGDEMLKFVAGRVKTYFGDELTFRVGGDEFVAFAPDLNRVGLEEVIDAMKRAIEAENYHIAVGYEILDLRQDFSVKDLINTAELRMRRDKEQYYNNKANDRRKSRN